MKLADLVEAILDPDLLSDLTGRSVIANRLRLKPGTSAIIGLADPRTAAPDGWARILWPAARVKAAKAGSRATRRGQRLTTRELGDLLLEVGEVWADPPLAARLRTAAGARLLDPGDPVLRYNPFRRLVVRHGSTTVRIATRHDRAALPLNRALHAGGVPVPGRHDDGALEGVSVLSFVGDTDLGSTPDLGATRSAGAALARLHAMAGALPADLRAGLAGRVADLAAQGRAHAGLLESLDPALAARVTTLTHRTVSAWAGIGHGDQFVHGDYLVHGDFSPDQVLLDSRTGRIWVTDLDRTALGGSAVDLGSYLAAAPAEDAAALIDGYRDAGGSVPGQRTLTAATARAVLLTALDPLRTARPDWHARVTARLDSLEGLLG